MSFHHLFIGTYTNKGSQGIYSLQLDAATGELAAPALAAPTPSPTYLALSPDRRQLYAVTDSPALAVAFAIREDRRQLQPLAAPQPSGGKAPCHLMADATGRVLVLAHYHAATVAALPIQVDGMLAPPASVLRHAGSSIDPERQASPHPHCAVLSPDNQFVFVCDLGTDLIHVYRLDPARATLVPHPPAVPATPGCGPRHLAFAPDGRDAFMLSEMGATLSSYRYAGDGALVLRDSQRTLPAGFSGENKSAAVRVHPNGRFVYASNRGPDTLAVFAFDPATGRLAPVQDIGSGGLQPRDFNLSPDGRWLVAAHQDSNNLVVFSVDANSGRLTPTGCSAQVPTPVCVVFLD